MTRRLILIVALVVGLTAPAWAGWDEGWAAYDRGDYETAMREWRPLAEQESSSAQYNIGLMYNNGVGVPQDYAEAVRWYHKAAEQDHAGAQNNLGLMYDNGHGLTQDYAEAVTWYRKAAEKGRAIGQNNLGLKYGKGQGVPQDYVKAVKWFRLAAMQGYADGQFNLAVMYDNGWGVEQDYVKAYIWFNLAAAQGKETARKNRDNVEKRMTPEQIAEAQRLAREWRPKVPTKTNNPLVTVQQRLKQRGYDPGTVDGLMGERTRSAIASFKADMASAGTLSDADQGLLELIEGLPK